ncbi:heavy metal translocating P-type ATPase [Belnapia rosea]|uniref:heavy metal translocating P-type ATPase n=1 Tax=Belnapia rosea TaxID=938405 RepID=UPI000886E234|nr:heavy metal translocating P-type ATPase [Belnapia rosea]SDB74728.1 Cu2+-exporting ATPase [Belnapia rosea]
MSATAAATPGQAALRHAAADSPAPCAHCGAPSIGGTLFCCMGCEGAHVLVSGLGLDAFYRRREIADGSLRPAVAAPSGDFAAHAQALGDGECQLELMVAGLTCGACVWLIEQSLAAEPDVLAARLSLSTRRLAVTWQGEPGRANDYAALLGRLGFRAVPWSGACLREADDAEGRELVRSLGIATFGAINVMLLSVCVWAGWDMGEATRGTLHWLAALVGVPVILIGGIPIYRSALGSLRAGRLNMDVAVSIAVLATTAMSLGEALRNGPFTWFDSATALLALLLAGRILDRSARRRARQAVSELLTLQEGNVARLGPDGTVEAVPVGAAAAGDRILVAMGERLRLDAVLESGEALLDTSITTGESLPRQAVPGDAVAAGAINLGAAAIFQVTRAAGEGSLAATARLLEQGEQARGRFVRLADRAVRLYVPTVHGLAALTFLAWWLWIGVSWQSALVTAVTVLIITCPCGLALAVPAVQAVAVGALFRRGVLVSNGSALERLATADHAVLDKTGTLTAGCPSLVPGDWTEEQLRAAAGLARASRHPLAQALAAACPDAPARHGVREIPGRGLRADSDLIGSAAFVGIPAPGEATVLWFRQAGRQPVAFRFSNQMRPDAPAAVQGLLALGLEVELLSGDVPSAVSEIARRAGIAVSTAAATPEDKAARIEALKSAGRRPIMVGDGINDAAALATAHVSVCLGEGADIAQRAADLIVNPGRLDALPVAIAAARQAQRLMRQNIVFSLVYNAVAVPVAVTGHVIPLFAALVMASSSLAVTLNALRAKNIWRPSTR